MLTLHRAERTDILAGALASVLADPLRDPLAPEIVALPARGVERWLGQFLATRLGTTDADSGDGVAANIDFRSPTELVDRVLGLVRGHRLRDDPWAPGPMVWALIAVLDDCLDDERCAVVARHLGHRPGEPPVPHRIGRRWSTGVDLSRLFRSYAAQRPTMIADWARGADTDGAGGPLVADLGWQAHVWRLLRARIGVPSPAERLPELCARIIAEPTEIALPERLSLFGPTRLTAEQREVLTAIARHRDVHVFLPHPGDRLWGTAAGTELANPLLASLSGEIRQTQLTLAPHIDRDVLHVDDAAHLPVASPALLERLQGGLRDDIPFSTIGSGPADPSVTVHSCHGPARQVEVAREVITGMFRDDPTLLPRDVIIMCPDVESFAPLIRATFGQQAGTHPVSRLRVRLADRSMTAVNPVLDAAVAVLAMAGGRVTAGDVADLCGRAPVRRRFGFDDDDLEQISRWMADAGIRWGMGESQRQAFGLRGFMQNTMQAGLDRIVLGVVADESSLQWMSRVLPIADIDSADIDLVGRFTEFAERLDRSLDRLSGVAQAQVWTDAILGVIDDLLDVAPSDAWQRAQAVDVITSTTEHSADVRLRRADVKAMLTDAVAARPTRANFRTGELTVCSMVPMRAVPHRIVVLIGLDDDVYPRVTRADGDDVLSRSPPVGERDPRIEDRQLLLDTIMSARERLVICYTGADPVSGLRRPPSVPVSEIIDALHELVDPGDADRVVVRHPLHGFDPANFSTDAPFSFDTAALAGARALTHPSTHVLTFDRTPLPPIAKEDLDVADLVAFFDHPVRGFCRQRMRFGIPSTDEVLSDEVDPELDPLDRWGIGDRLLRERLQGASRDALRGAELRRGTLPPFTLGFDALTPVVDDVERLVDAAASTLAVARRTVDVDVDLGDGRRLVGTVDGVHASMVFRAHFSRLAPKHRLATWITLLAAAATTLGTENEVQQGRTLGRGRGNRLAYSRLDAPADPVAALRHLVDTRDDGLRTPLPLPVAAAAVYATARHDGSSEQMAIEAAEREFGDRFGDHDDPYISYVFPDGFSAMTASVPDGGRTFSELAQATWAPMLDGEQLTMR